MLLNDVKVDIDFPEFFGKTKSAVLMDNPSEISLSWIIDGFFGIIESIAKYSGEYDYGINMCDALMPTNSSVKILDYGNINRLSWLKLYFKNFKRICVSDVDSMYSDFMRFLCHKYGILIEFRSQDDLKSSGEFQYIICQKSLNRFESHDRLRDPLAVLSDLKSVLSKGLFIHFDEVVNSYPLFNSEEKAFKTLASFGFEPAWENPGGLITGFQRVS